MPFEFGKIVQIAAAVLGIPAAAAGTYSVYQTYFTNEVTCQKLRTSIIIVMEKNVPADAKRTLLRKEVGEFDAKCGAADPDARTLFLAAMREGDGTAPEAATATRAIAAAAPGTSVREAPRAVSVFGMSGRDERGWVAIGRKADKAWEPNFTGFKISDTALPPAGTVLTALQALPVWQEPQAGANDPAKLTGRLPQAACVKVVATRVGTGRLWAEVTPASCS
jgi:hypothetical protein